MTWQMPLNCTVVIALASPITIPMFWRFWLVFISSVPTSRHVSRGTLRTISITSSPLKQQLPLWLLSCADMVTRYASISSQLKLKARVSIRARFWQHFQLINQPRQAISSFIEMLDWSATLNAPQCIFAPVLTHPLKLCSTRPRRAL